LLAERPPEVRLIENDSLFHKATNYLWGVNTPGEPLASDRAPFTLPTELSVLRAKLGLLKEEPGERER
jgi:hypothetical protein